MTAHAFNPGFRLSKLDAVVLFVGTYVSLDIAAVFHWIGAAMVFVIAHFFLFCNVIRMARSRELAWSALFVGLAISTDRFGWPGWPTTFAVSLVATVILVVLETRKPSYHGAFWQWINPGLQEWWMANREV